MFKSYCFTLSILFFSCMVNAQLLDLPKKKNVYDEHPYFKYYGDVVKKETGKSLLQLAYDSPSNLKTGQFAVMSESELHAINIAVAAHQKGASNASPVQNSIYVYKIDSKTLYIHVVSNKSETRHKFGGGDSEFIFDLEKMIVIDKWVNQK